MNPPEKCNCGAERKWVQDRRAGYECGTRFTRTDAGWCQDRTWLATPQCGLIGAQTVPAGQQEPARVPPEFAMRPRILLSNGELVTIERAEQIITQLRGELEAANQHVKILMETLMQAILAEREACACIADRYAETAAEEDANYAANNIAERIRARSNPPGNDPAISPKAGE